MKKKPVIIIGGPTASGKSALALDLAHHLGGVIINGDSVQLYKGLDILSAKPTEAEKQQVDHRLYDLFDGNTICSVALWQDLALKEIDAAHGAGKIPIVVGGTGLYLQSLVEGLSKIPPISPQVRQKARDDYDAMGAELFHQRLKQQDPLMGNQLPPEDRQRCIRAWEVLQQTGHSLQVWQREKETAKIDALDPFQIVLLPDREELNCRTNKRFESMVQQGAVAEVKAFLDQAPPADHPLHKAVGVRELRAYIRQDISLEEAIERAQIATRQYSKRQSTWFRNQVKGALVVDTLYTPAIKEDILQKIHTLGSLKKT